MQASRSSSVRQAFVLTEADIRRLAGGLQRLTGPTTIVATCIDGIRRTFESIDEFGDYSNADTKRIVTLSLTGRDPVLGTSAEITFRISERDSISFSAAGPEERVLDIVALFDGEVSAARPWYSGIATIDFIRVLFALALIPTATLLATVVFGVVPVAPSSLGAIVLSRESFVGFIVGALPWPVGVLLNRLRNQFFPVGDFATGHGARRFRRGETVRTVVVVAFFVSLIAGIATVLVIGG